MNHHFGIMARYNAWANSRLYAEACSLSVETYPKNVCAFFGSLHGTLNHLLVTDRIWMHRFTGEGEHPAQLNAIMFDELPSLEVARRAEDARIVQYVEDLSEEEIGKDFSYSTTKGVPQRFMLRDSVGTLVQSPDRIIAVKSTASSLFWDFRNPSHLISWQCIAR